MAEARPFMEEPERKRGRRKIINFLDTYDPNEKRIASMLWTMFRILLSKNTPLVIDRDDDVSRGLDDFSKRFKDIEDRDVPFGSEASASSSHSRTHDAPVAQRKKVESSVAEVVPHFVREF